MIDLTTLSYVQKGLASCIFVIVLIILYDTCVQCGKRQKNGTLICWNCCEVELFLAILVFCVLCLDLASDIVTGLGFYYRGRITAATLTLAIVVVGGYMVTFTQYAYGSPSYFSNPEDIGRQSKWRYCKIPLALIPCLLPLHSGIKRIQLAWKLDRAIKTNQQGDNICKTRANLTEYKDHGFWDAWCESVYESGPQVVLQLVLLVERTTPLETFSDWFPVGSIIMSVISLGTGPVKLFKLWDIKYGTNKLKIKWERWTILNYIKLLDLAAYLAKATQLLWCTIVIVSFRLWLPWSPTEATLISLLVIFLVVDVPFILMENWIGVDYRETSENNPISESDTRNEDMKLFTSRPALESNARSLSVRFDNGTCTIQIQEDVDKSGAEFASHENKQDFSKSCVTKDNYAKWNHTNHPFVVFHRICNNFPSLVIILSRLNILQWPVSPSKPLRITESKITGEGMLESVSTGSQLLDELQVTDDTHNIGNDQTISQHENPSISRDREKREATDEFHRILNGFYVVVSLLLVLFCVFQQSFWLSNFTGRIVALVYLVSLNFTLFLLFSINSKRFVGICMPYFFGVVISRIIERCILSIRSTNNVKFSKYVINDEDRRKQYHYFA